MPPCSPADGLLVVCWPTFYATVWFPMGHSTETTVLQVLSKLLQAVDRGDLGALVLLDLTAAFDTMEIDIPL